MYTHCRFSICVYIVFINCQLRTKKSTFLHVTSRWSSLKNRSHTISFFLFLVFFFCFVIKHSGTNGIMDPLFGTYDHNSISFTFGTRENRLEQRSLSLINIESFLFSFILKHYCYTFHRLIFIPLHVHAVEEIVCHIYLSQSRTFTVSSIQTEAQSSSFFSGFKSTIAWSSSGLHLQTEQNKLDKTV